MNTEVHFRLNAITKIKLRKRQDSGYSWKEATPAKKRFFGLITVSKAKRAGWAYYESDYRNTTESLLSDRYRFDEVKIEIYQRPHVTVRLVDKSEIYSYFDTDDEAIKWIDEIIKESEHKFAVIGR